MNGLAAIAVAGLIAAAGVLWFQTSPSVVTIKVTPMQPDASMPTFRQVQDDVQRGKMRP